MRLLISFIFLLATSQAISQTALAERGALEMYPKHRALNFFDEPEAISTVNSEESLSKDTLQNQLIAKYGDPSKPHPVKAVEDAPAPYKGMLAAIEAGDDKLAFAYAKQYEDYLENLKGVANKAVALGHLAKEEMGTLPPSSNPDEQEYAELKASIGLIENEEMEQLRQDELNAQALTLLKKAKKPEFDLEAGSIEDKETAEKIDRLTARRDLQGKIHFISDGDLDLLFFFKPYQKESIELGKSLAQFHLTISDEDKLALIGFSITGDSFIEFNRFKKSTNAKFNLTAGQTLADKMQVTETPTLMIVDATTRKFHKITKVVSAEYLDEVIKIIRGQK